MTVKQEEHFIGMSLPIRGRDRLFPTSQRPNERRLVNMDDSTGTLELDFFAPPSMQVSNPRRNLSVQLTQDQALNSLCLDDDCLVECNDC